MPESYPLDTTRIADSLCPAIGSIARVSIDVARTIARAGLGGSTALESGVGRNTDGDTQKALDVLADNAFHSALCKSGVRWYASEERADVDMIDQNGTLALAIDPLDGSSNIGVNVSVGTIFSLYHATDDAQTSFLRPGTDQIAAGYVIYGPQTTLTLTVGDGVSTHILDSDAGSFIAVDRRAPIPEQTSEFAVNSSNYRHWPEPVRHYIDDCLLGENGPRARNFNMRWVASLVAEAHRIMTRGGVFLYPSDSRAGYQDGRLRFLYECAPVAFLVEQSGGSATDGFRRLLDLSAPQIHCRSPLVFGSRQEVDQIAGYFQTSNHRTSALFGARGLFRP